jgi:hypothetical protein
MSRMKRRNPGSHYLGALLLMACLLGAYQAHAWQEACGDKDSGSCFEVHDTPYCDWSACCEAVCDFNPICCELEWDADCVAAAIKMCIDCNGNGIFDEQDIADGTSADCNGNSIPDECDISNGTSADCNANGIPDECDPDCNANGIPDECDIADGTSEDCNGNGIPDQCVSDLDCNDNGIPDECEPGTPLVRDCNGNGQEDFYDIATSVSIDADADGIPDECEGVLDVVFVLDVTSSKSQEYLGIQIADDLASDESKLLAAIEDRSNGCAKYGMVTFRDLVEVDLPLTGDSTQLQSAAGSLVYTGGGGGAEASDRALLEVLLQGNAETCPPSKGYDCCTGDGDPEDCTYPRVCLASTQRFDTPFRKRARRIVVHVTDDKPGGCDDNHVPSIDLVFAERIADLAGRTGARIVAIADASSAVEAASLYADESDGRLITPFTGDCISTTEHLAQVLRGLDVGPWVASCCPADLDRDGYVNGVDLAIFLSLWGSIGSPCNMVGDLDGNGIISGGDLALLLFSWGTCPC